jgi:dienelactone hydrolase
MDIKSSLLASLASMITAFTVFSCAGISDPAHYAPTSGKGPLVLMFSGRTGPLLYTEFARRLADTGFRVLLLDANDFSVNQVPACQGKIRTLLKDYLPVSAGKVAIIGYSQGGAVALSCAAGMPESVAVVVAYYPATKLISDTKTCIERFRVPIIVLQGEDDRYFDCCTVEKVRDMQQTARAKGMDFELIVYPYAGHGFNLGSMKDPQLDYDSWRKTIDALKKHLY